MTSKELIETLGLKVTPAQMAAVEKLEERGLSFCGNFGYENAADILKEMDQAFLGGYLEKWMLDRGLVG